jgi:hypothetical protein
MYLFKQSSFIYNMNVTQGSHVSPNTVIYENIEYGLMMTVYSRNMLHF